MMEADRGCALVDETVRSGRRQSMFDAYVRPRLGQGNLTVLANALVTRITWQGDRATGIEFEHQGTTVQVMAAREVVVSLGAIHTPKLLMQSGLGEAAHLDEHAIAVKQDLPGVGCHLHDHVSIGYVVRNTQRTPPPIPRSQVACFWKSRADLDSPNFYAYARQGAAITPENAALAPSGAGAWSLMLGMRPASRGRVRLRGASPSDPVTIDANYLGDPRDMADLIDGLEMARTLASAEALRPFTGAEIAPGRLAGEDLRRFIRRGLTTFWHQSGTARMGRDHMAVVDAQLRVHGVQGLRVADASILPRVTSGNTMAPCVVIGELAADFRRGTWR